MGKIVHLTSVHKHFDVRIFYKECCSLAAYGYETALIVPSMNDEVMRGVKIKSVPLPGNRFERLTKTMWKIYQAGLRENARIYQIHDPELLIVGLLLKLHGKIIVYDVHEDVPRQILSKYWIPKPFRKVVAWGFEQFEKFAAKHLDAVVAATPFIRNRFLNLGCKAVDVNNYPILNEFNYDDGNWSDKEKAVCYVGGISEQRGLTQMLQAISLTNAKLILAGPFFQKALRAAALTFDGWNHVEEMGLINRDQVKEVLARSMAGLVLLHPFINYWNSLPVKMFEYMAAGIPVIASDFPLWRKIIARNKCGFWVNPYNPVEIAEKINWIVNHLEESKQMGLNGRRAVQDQYNWEREANKLIALMEELVQQQGK